MIRLDAATVLLQWASGGMAFCWFTTRRRQVGLGYGWLLRGIYLALAASAFVVGLRFGPVAGRDVASLGVTVACLAALGAVDRAGGTRGCADNSPSTTVAPLAWRR